MMNEKKQQQDDNIDNMEAETSDDDEVKEQEDESHESTLQDVESKSQDEQQQHQESSPSSYEVESTSVEQSQLLDNSAATAPSSNRERRESRSRDACNNNDGGGGGGDGDYLKLRRRQQQRLRHTTPILSQQQRRPQQRNKNNHEAGEEEEEGKDDQVDLLQLAAQRSHGIYLDTDHHHHYDDSAVEAITKTDDAGNNNSVKKKAPKKNLSSGLISGKDSITEEKLRHFNLNLNNTITTNNNNNKVDQNDQDDDNDRVDEVEKTKNQYNNSSASHIKGVQDDSDLNAKYRRIDNHVSSLSPMEIKMKQQQQQTEQQQITSQQQQEENTNNRISEERAIPGAYQGMPGRGFVRTEDFHGNLIRPTITTDITDENPSVRSSGGNNNHTISFHNNSNSSSNVLESYDHGEQQHHDHHHNRRRRQQQQQLPSALLNYRTSTGNFISAVRVDEDDLELHIRDEIANNAAQAEIIDLDRETATKVHQVRNRYICFTIVVIVIVVIIFAITYRGIRNNSNDEDDDHHDNNDIPSSQDTTTAPFSTLEMIRNRGFLNCGVAATGDNSTYYHLFLQNATLGFVGDFCGAIAAANLQGNANYTLDVIPGDASKALIDGSVDVLFISTSIYSDSLDWTLFPTIPLAYSTPIFYDGVGVGGIPEYVRNCSTPGGFDYILLCRSLKVCVVRGTTAFVAVEERLHPNQIVEVPSLTDVYTMFGAGCCNIIATDSYSERIEAVVREFGNYTGDYELGVGIFARRPFAAATRKQNYLNYKLSAPLRIDQSPHMWTQFVDWILQAIIAAEGKNLTKETATRFAETDVFGPEYGRIFQQAIAAVGHYGEIYSRNMEDVVPRSGWNGRYTGSTGLHYSKMVGNIAEHGVPPYENGTINEIIQRGKLRCAIPIYHMTESMTGDPSAPALNFSLPHAMQDVVKFLMGTHDFTSSLEDLGSASIDVELCRALASSIFQGRYVLNDDDSLCYDALLADSNTTLEITFLTDPTDGYSKLRNGEIDVISGYRIDLESDVKEATTGDGFTFSQPFFYGLTSRKGQFTENNRCVVTREDDDSQWSDFVQLVVTSLFFAEENGITQNNAKLMPSANLYGPDFQRILRDAIYTVGNYGELYERSMERILPRQGTPNMMNIDANPQIVAMPIPGLSSNSTSNEE